MSDEHDLGARARELRRAFDASFAAAPGAARTGTHDFLFVRSGGARWAVPLAQVAHVEVATRITRAPSPVAELLGLAAVRRALLPVYHLGALIGGDATTAPRWVIAVAPAPVALAMDSLERYVRSPEAPAASAPDGRDGAFVAGLIREEDGSFRPVLDVVALCHEIARRAQAARRSGGGAP